MYRSGAAALLLGALRMLYGCALYFSWDRSGTVPNCGRRAADRWSMVACHIGWPRAPIAGIVRTAPNGTPVPVLRQRRPKRGCLLFVSDNKKGKKGSCALCTI